MRHVGQATVDMRMRLSAAIDRVRVAEQHGKLAPSRSIDLRRQVEKAQREMTVQQKGRGFVSAASLASFDRLVKAVDSELSSASVAGPQGGPVAPAGGIASDPGAGEMEYDCQNEPVAVAIPGDTLDAALGKLRLATRCPISGTELAAGKRSKPVVGTMVPAAALRAMLVGTGLQSRTIKGGFEISRARRR